MKTAGLMKWLNRPSHRDPAPKKHPPHWDPRTIKAREQWYGKKKQQLSKKDPDNQSNWQDKLDDERYNRWSKTKDLPVEEQMSHWKLAGVMNLSLFAELRRLYFP